MAYPVTSILWKGHVGDGAVPADNFIVSDSGSISSEQLKDGEALMQLLYLSVDPYMRGRMREMKVSKLQTISCKQGTQG
jgi:NADPH-dependent curcumin reductase CurA